MTEEEREQYLAKEIIIIEQKFYEDWMFWLLLFAGFFGLGIMILLCICLINMKRKNDAIISKVILMSEKQKKQDDTQKIDLDGNQVDNAPEPVAPSKPFRDEGDGFENEGSRIMSAQSVSRPGVDNP